jgi:signal-transduction protein with cAMP-binding, CBS, and nucleotidyltransferase domain
MSDRTVIQSITTGKVLCTLPQTSVFQAACMMTEANCGSVLIVNESGAMLGILTERDLMTKVVAKAMDPQQTAVSEVMTPHPRFVSPETHVSDALLMMKEGGFRHLPVLSSTYKIVGMFSIRDAAPDEVMEANSKAQYLNVLGESVGY